MQIFNVNGVIQRHRNELEGVRDNLRSVLKSGRERLQEMNRKLSKLTSDKIIKIIINLFIIVSHIDCTFNITHIKIYNIKQSITSHRIGLRHTFIYTNIHCLLKVLTV
jgi:hypothetical protein